MKTNKIGAVSLTDIASRVKGLLEENSSAQFVCVVLEGQTMRYGVTAKRNSFLSLCEAVGEPAAHDYCNRCNGDTGSYHFDEAFGRDVYRMHDDKSGECVAIFIKG